MTVDQRLAYFEFEHKHRNAEATLSVELTGPTTDCGFTNISIMENGRPVGQLGGIMITEAAGTCFYNGILTNFRRSTIPRAVGASIAELLIREVVDCWISAPASFMSNDASNMYEMYLAGRPQLMVTKSGLLKGNRYFVQRNPI